MANDNLIRVLRRLAGARAGGDASDGQLLARFAIGQEEAAFNSLVERHGPMVLGVCRRALKDEHDAEDALQATFLTLAKKARSLLGTERLGNWLYGVALHTCQQVERSRRRRRFWERQAPVPQSTEPSTDALWSEVRAVLDEEIKRLPSRYREPFILCYLEGKTNEQAADDLGCPKGTIQSRLSWARERLKVCLTRRGITLTVAALTALLADNASARSIPLPLVKTTVETVLAALAGKALAPEILALTQGVLAMMWWSKVKTVVISLILVGTLATGTGVVVMHGGETKEVVQVAPPKGKEAKKAEKAIEEKAENNEMALVQGAWKVISFEVDGENRPQLAEKEITIYFTGGDLVTLDPQISFEKLPGGKRQSTGSGPGKLYQTRLKLHVDSKPTTFDLGGDFLGLRGSAKGTLILDGHNLRIPLEFTGFPVELIPDQLPLREVKLSPKQNPRVVAVLKRLYNSTDFRLEGTWSVALAKLGGKRINLDRVTIEGNRIEGVGGELPFVGIYYVRKEEKPATIDMLCIGPPVRPTIIFDAKQPGRPNMQGRNFPGIYLFDGDTVSMAFNLQFRPERPTSFVSQANSENDFLLVLKRGAEDKKGIQGMWQISGGASAGKPFGQDWKDLRFNVTSERMDIVQNVVDDKNEPLSSAGLGSVIYQTQDGRIPFVRLPYTIDPGHNPKWIDFTGPNGITMKGIFNLDGDKLEIVFDKSGLRGRPSEFISEAGTSNDVYWVLRRVVPSPAEANAKKE